MWLWLCECFFRQEGETKTEKGTEQVRDGSHMAIREKAAIPALESPPEMRDVVDKVDKRLRPQATLVPN